MGVPGIPCTCLAPVGYDVQKNLRMRIARTCQPPFSKQKKLMVRQAKSMEPKP